MCNAVLIYAVQANLGKGNCVHLMQRQVTVNRKSPVRLRLLWVPPRVQKHACYGQFKTLNCPYMCVFDLSLAGPGCIPSPLYKRVWMDGAKVCVS